MDTRDLILITVDDLVADLLHYGRKEDDALPVGAIEAAVNSGDIMSDEIVQRFRQALERRLRGRT